MYEFDWKRVSLDWVDDVPFRIVEIFSPEATRIVSVARVYLDGLKGEKKKNRI